MEGGSHFQQLFISLVCLNYRLSGIFFKIISIELVSLQDAITTNGQQEGSIKGQLAGPHRGVPVMAIEPHEIFRLAYCTESHGTIIIPSHDEASIPVIAQKHCSRRLGTFLLLCCRSFSQRIFSYRVFLFPVTFIDHPTKFATKSNKKAIKYIFPVAHLQSWRNSIILILFLVLFFSIRFLSLIIRNCCYLSLIIPLLLRLTFTCPLRIAPLKWLGFLEIKPPDRHLNLVTVTCILIQGTRQRKVNFPNLSIHARKNHRL
mmetsp:Transcript_8043/g.9980  ORF Transcript_8043/g.9980 Transcript_8043/m.9980 type:complete len:260 (-) Transcript_8043:179-958(-)